MKIGDKVTFGCPQYDGTLIRTSDTIYTVVDISDDYVKVKHPEIGGHFIFSKSQVVSVESKK